MSSPYINEDGEVFYPDDDQSYIPIHIANPGFEIVGPGGEDLRPGNNVDVGPGADPIVGPGGEDLRPGGGTIHVDPIVGQDPSSGGGEPDKGEHLVGPGGEDLSTSVAVQKDGKYYDSTGRLLYDPKSTEVGGIMSLINKYLGKDTGDKIKKLFIDDKGNVNLATLGAVGAGIYGLMGGNEMETGIYKGKIPKYSAVRQQVEQPEYEPYSGKPAMGRDYFTDTQFVKNPNAESLAEANKTAKEQADLLAKYEPKIKEKTTEEKTGITTLPESKKVELPDPNALITKERGIVADKNVPAVDVMPEVKRLNPQLDWSKYNPDKMTMDYDDFDLARDNYLRGKGYTPPKPATTPEPTFRYVSGNGLTAGHLAFGPAPAESAPGSISTTQVQNGTANTTPANKSIFDDMEPARHAAFDKDGNPMASGGIAMLAKGRYLRGATDGMADKIPSSIDNKQPAKLSHGEFVIPADVVSHLGNGNSDAGADVLYKMMDRVRTARTGTKKQGKRINAEKFTPGGIAGYKSGGIVAFDAGGGVKANPITTTNPGGSTTTTGLADWAGDAVTDYIARGQALAAKPYEAYKGPLTAGASDLQTQAFNKAKGLGGGFDAAAVNQYMNPYIQNALQPQLNELRRQSDISQQGMSGKYAAAGALGGARDAITRSEGIRNLLNQQSGVIGSAYQSAYDKAMNQYNTSRQQDISDINAMLASGAAQRGIEQDSVTANKAAFEAQREDPYSKLKFEQSLFTGLPLSASATTPNLSELQKLGLTGDQMTKLYDMIGNWLNPPATKTATTDATKTSSGSTVPG